MSQKWRLYNAEDLAWSALDKPFQTVPDGWQIDRGRVWKDVGVETGLPPGVERSAITTRRWRAHRRRVTTEQRRRLNVVVDAVKATDWWATNVPRARSVTAAVSTGRGATGGMFDRGWGVNHSTRPYHSSGLIIAHELAHVADMATLSGRGWASSDHEARFAGAYVQLTRLICGTVMAAALLAAFEQYDVDVDYTGWPDPGERGLFDQVADWAHPPVPEPEPMRQLALFP